MADLKAFALALLGDPECYGEDAFEAAVEHGLLIAVKVYEPCGDGCHCADYHGGFEGGVECYRLCDELRGERERT